MKNSLDILRIVLYNEGVIRTARHFPVRHSEMSGSPPTILYNIRKEKSGKSRRGEEVPDVDVKHKGVILAPITTLPPNIYQMISG